MERRISSDGATTSAKVFSCLPIPVAGLVLCVAIYNGQVGLSGSAAALALLAAYVWVARRFAWSMLDEVTDCGDCLLARRGAVQDKIFLRDIEDVIDRPFGRPPKAIVKLRARSAFGWNLVFVPARGEEAAGGVANIAADLRHRVRMAISVAS